MIEESYDSVIQINRSTSKLSAIEYIILRKVDSFNLFEFIIGSLFFLFNYFNLRVFPKLCMNKIDIGKMLILTHWQRVIRSWIVVSQGDFSLNIMEELTKYITSLFPYVISLDGKKLICKFLLSIMNILFIILQLFSCC